MILSVGLVIVFIAIVYGQKAAQNVTCFVANVVGLAIIVLIVGFIGAPNVLHWLFSSEGAVCIVLYVGAMLLLNAIFDKK